MNAYKHGRVMQRKDIPKKVKTMNNCYLCGAEAPVVTDVTMNAEGVVKPRPVCSRCVIVLRTNKLLDNPESLDWDFIRAWLRDLD